MSQPSSEDEAAFTADLARSLELIKATTDAQANALIAQTYDTMLAQVVSALPILASEETREGGLRVLAMVAENYESFKAGIATAREQHE